MSDCFGPQLVDVRPQIRNICIFISLYKNIIDVLSTLLKPNNVGMYPYKIIQIHVYRLLPLFKANNTGKCIHIK